MKGASATLARVIVISLLSLIAVAVVSLPAAALQQDWNCNLRASWGDLNGFPRDDGGYFGVIPWATDDYDLIDAKAVPDPPGAYVSAWFHRPAWNKGRIMADFRAPIAEGTSKRWGTALTDTWNVKTNLDNGPSGYFHADCDPLQAVEYPVAASIHITWVFGVSEEPPYPLPPEGYTFSLIYRGGINPKPAGTKLPDPMDPPAINFTWDMEATPYIVLPLWSVDFHPWMADCSGYGAPDTAKFFILVNNPADSGLTCAITMHPGDGQPAPVTVTFTATACCGGPFAFSWDFGDGGSGAGNPIAHTYSAAGTYTVTCTVRDDAGGVGVCQTSVIVARAGPIYVDCNSTCAHPDGSEDCPYQSIQDAIGVATDGETVLVLPGTYHEEINFLGKAITVTSTDPLDPSIVEATVIEGQGRSRVVGFGNGEVSDSVLRGFTIDSRSASDCGVRCSPSSPTIANNTVTGNAVGIWCDFSSPVITNNTIVGNGRGSPGAAVHCHRSSPIIASNTIMGNHGSGICCVDASPRITNNWITGNSTDYSGGGIWCDGSCSATIINCTIADNTAALWGDAIYCSHESSPTMRNSIVWNHDCPGCGLIALDDTSSIAISYSLACTDAGEPWPGEGNICADPQFADPDNGDYHLLPTSPCVGAGDPEDAPVDDVDGDPRGGDVDIGADQWVSSPFRFQLRGGCWHLITIPCDPLNPDPWELFDELRPPNKPLDLLSGTLYRCDDAGVGYVMYWRSDAEEFGPITPGVGYWLWLYDDETIAYEVECSSDPQSLHFATAGWHLMGYPQPRHFYLDDTLWCDATTEPRPFSAVTQPGDLLWLQDPLYCWSPSDRGYLPCGLRPEEDDHLRAFKGYWFYTFVDDVTLEVPPP